MSCSTGLPRPRLARLPDVFVAQYIVEAKQVLDDDNNFAWRQKHSRQFTAAQARDQAYLCSYPKQCIIA